MKLPYLGGGEEGRRGRGGGEELGVREEEGRGVEEIQGTYWTRDYQLISCSEWKEGVDSIFPPKKVPTSNFSIILYF